MRKFRPVWGLLLALLLAIGFGAQQHSILRASPAAQNAVPFEIRVRETRADLELLADSALGAAVRPEGWTGNIDNRTESYLVDLWFDNELLAGAIFGESSRPAGWIGASPNGFIIARNVRHDLELSADEFFGLTFRPQEWRGGLPIERCDRSLQTLVYVLNLLYGVTLPTAQDAPNFCAQARDDADVLALNQAFNSPEQQSFYLDQVWLTRGDLERLADELLGLNNRPESYNNNRNRNSPTLIPDLLLDLELLSDELLGFGVRPDGWIGLIGTTPYISARNLRHDLELLTHAAYTPVDATGRPRSWQNSNPVAACDPALVTLSDIIANSYGVVLIDLLPLPASPENCEQAALLVNQRAENPPVQDIVGGGGEADSPFFAESQYAFAYLDPAATQYMGVMPPGTRFRAWYRNFNTSSMMFVSGEDFAVYIDRRWTTLSQEVFDRLPTLDGVIPATFCDASWCNGPGPTPTPTGYGALEELVFQSTPPATLDAGQVAGSGKTQVSWNYIRVTYLQDFVDQGFARVALEICAEPAQITCEPVLSVFDNNIGAAKAVVSQFNGLNVFEFNYGYTANLVIEGTTYFSPDIWISDPTIRN